MNEGDAGHFIEPASTCGCCRELVMYELMGRAYLSGGSICRLIGSRVSRGDDALSRPSVSVPIIGGN